MSLEIGNCVCCGKAMPAGKEYCPHCGIKQSQWREKINPFRLFNINIKNQDYSALSLADDQLIKSWNKYLFHKKISIEDINWAREILRDIELRNRWSAVYFQKNIDRNNDLMPFYLFGGIIGFIVLLVGLIGLIGLFL